MASGTLDRGFIDQHDGNVVLHGINPVALRTLQAFRILAVVEGLLAGWAHQDFQQILGNHEENCTAWQRPVPSTQYRVKSRDSVRGTGDLIESQPSTL